jgi:hypothetical protein
VDREFPLLDRLTKVWRLAANDLLSKHASGAAEQLCETSNLAAHTKSVNAALISAAMLTRFAPTPLSMSPKSPALRIRSQTPPRTACHSGWPVSSSHGRDPRKDVRANKASVACRRSFLRLPAPSRRPSSAVLICLGGRLAPRPSHVPGPTSPACPGFQFSGLLTLNMALPNNALVV